MPSPRVLASSKVRGHCAGNLVLPQLKAFDDPNTLWPFVYVPQSPPGFD